MKILLCAATEMEISPTIQLVAAHGLDNIDIIITGVGLMASTHALTKSVSIHRPQLLLQAGVAGTFEAKLPLATVVVVRSETIGDLGVMEKGAFQSLFNLKLVSSNLYPWKDGQLINENELVKNTGLPVVDGVSVNEISTNVETVSYYKNQLKAQIETMEGAALHYIGLMEQIPFLQIRSLSNFIGERDKTKWMMDKAIINLNLELQRILKIFS